MTRGLLLTASFLLFLSLLADCRSQAVNLDEIRLPAGFSISIYADNLPDARSLALSPSGTLFIGSRGEGKVYAVQDTNHDNRADRTYIIASGLNMPNGVAFRNGALYVAEVSRLLRFDAIEAHLDNPGRPTVVYDDLPTDRHHGWKYINFGPDGRLYIPVGTPCNICEVKDPYGTILRMQPDGSQREVFARGIRNSVGFDWNPLTGVLWFTDNGRDWLGDNLPPDELNRAPRAGLHFGFPYLHGRAVADPEFGRQGKDIVKTPPAYEFEAHVAPLGIQFYTGTMFPAKYRNQLFVAQHGSWNRSTPVGYRVVIVFIENGKATGCQVFADGWLRGDRASGRPVDLEVMADGALLISDDRAGLIYRVAYNQKMN
ncbi:MAG: sorbosone dehydrogenase family protein [Deltaproteobacteria bacterium]